MLNETYQVSWEKKALKKLHSLDRKTATEIIEKIEYYLTKDLRKLGKRLTGKFQGLWSCRIRSYRVIYDIIENKVLIAIFRSLASSEPLIKLITSQP